MPKVLIAQDMFKGSASAAQVAAPLMGAAGGPAPGSTSTLCRPTEGLSSSWPPRPGYTIPVILPAIGDAMLASSRGTGELIRSALDAGCTHQDCARVGGSACTDGGPGLLSALGAVLLDRFGNPVQDSDEPLASPGSVDLSGLYRRLTDVDFVLASDVDSPLLGATGAAYLHSAQTGATADQTAALGWH